VRLKPSLFICTTMKEIWKNIKGFENYLISNFGKVKRLDNHKELKPRIHNSYQRIALYKDGKQFNFFVHRLILMNFIGQIPNLVCNHKNGIKTDNRLENLEWVTIKENIHHAINTGLKSKIPKGENHANSKLNWSIVNEIRENKNNYSQRFMSQKYGVCNQLISQIVNNKIWKI